MHLFLLCYDVGLHHQGEHDTLARHELSYQSREAIPKSPGFRFSRSSPLTEQQRFTGEPVFHWATFTPPLFTRYKRSGRLLLVGDCGRRGHGTDRFSLLTLISTQLVISRTNLTSGKGITIRLISWLAQFKLYYKSSASLSNKANLGIAKIVVR